MYLILYIIIFYATVPVPSVIVSTLKDQIVGQSLILKCNITTVRGITSRVDVIWSSDGLDLIRTEGINVSSVLTESLLYSNSYTISQLSTADEKRTYFCKVLVITPSSVETTNSVTLNVTGKPSITYYVSSA